jgi:hypothetical protein
MAWRPLAQLCLIEVARRGGPSGAQDTLADAADLWDRDGAPYDTAVARRERGTVLRALDQPAAAVREWRAAWEEFATLGAARAVRAIDAPAGQRAGGRRWRCPGV